MSIWGIYAFEEYLSPCEDDSGSGQGGGGDSAGDSGDDGGGGTGASGSGGTAGGGSAGGGSGGGTSGDDSGSGMSTDEDGGMSMDVGGTPSDDNTSDDTGGFGLDDSDGYYSGGFNGYSDSDIADAYRDDPQTEQGLDLQGFFNEADGYYSDDDIAEAYGFLPNSPKALDIVGWEPNTITGVFGQTVELNDNFSPKGLLGQGFFTKENAINAIPGVIGLLAGPVPGGLASLALGQFQKDEAKSFEAAINTVYSVVTKGFVPSSYIEYAAVTIAPTAIIGFYNKQKANSYTVSRDTVNQNQGNAYGSFTESYDNSGGTASYDDGGDVADMNSMIDERVNGGGSESGVASTSTGVGAAGSAISTSTFSSSSSQPIIDQAVSRPFSFAGGLNQRYLSHLIANKTVDIFASDMLDDTLEFVTDGFFKETRKITPVLDEFALNQVHQIMKGKIF